MVSGPLMRASAPRDGERRPIEWRAEPGLVDYPQAVAFMERRAGEIADGKAGECVWLVEHPPIYTAGTSAKAADLLEARFPVYQTGRGGQFTYHGPGQRVAYAMMDLRRPTGSAADAGDVRCFVHDLEEWLICTLAQFGVEGERRAGRVGIWVAHGNHEEKIAAIGVRVRRWITYHGVALNVAPDLSHFTGIVPCGIRDHGVTSLADLGIEASMSEVDAALRSAFEAIFGAVSQTDGLR